MKIWKELALVIGLFLLCVQASGDLGELNQGHDTTPEELAKFFTDKKIIPGGKDETCSDRVLEYRKKVAEEGGPKQGVVPTVSLGAALVIFLLVGVFAAGIAHGFQMVRTH